MVVDDWVEDCNSIPMFPTVIKKTRHTEEKAGQGTMKGMTLGSRLGRLERQFRNSCLNCQWGVIGAISYKKAEERREGKRQKQGQMNSSRLLKWESYVGLCWGGVIVMIPSLLAEKMIAVSVSRFNECLFYRLFLFFFLFGAVWKRKWLNGISKVFIQIFLFTSLLYCLMVYIFFPRTALSALSFHTRVYVCFTSISSKFSCTDSLYPQIIQNNCYVLEYLFIGYTAIANVMKLALVHTIF